MVDCGMHWSLDGNTACIAFWRIMEIRKSPKMHGVKECPNVQIFSSGGDSSGEAKLLRTPWQWAAVRREGFADRRRVQVTRFSTMNFDPSRMSEWILSNQRQVFSTWAHFTFHISHFSAIDFHWLLCHMLRIYNARKKPEQRTREDMVLPLSPTNTRIF